MSDQVASLKLQILDGFSDVTARFDAAAKRIEAASKSAANAGKESSSGWAASVTAVSTAITALGSVFNGLTSIVSGVGAIIKSVFSAIVSTVEAAARAFVSFGRSVLDSGAEWESMSVRMTALSGSVKAGAESMKFLAAAAAKLPYTLTEVIQGASGIKAFGMEIQKWMTPLSDVAAFMQLSLPEAAGAMGRAFAGGAGAADIFRERGVLTMISLKTGIADLTKITLPEFREAMFKTFTDGTIGIAGMADKLGKTFTGKLSNVMDKWDEFKRLVAESFFPAVKGSLDKLLAMLDSWSKDGTLALWAKTAGDALTGAFNGAVKWAEAALATVKKWSDSGALVTWALSVYDTTASVFSAVGEFVGNVYGKIKEWSDDGSLARWWGAIKATAVSLWNTLIDMVPATVIMVGDLAAGAMKVAQAFTEIKVAAGETLIEIGAALGNLPAAVQKMLGITDKAAQAMILAGIDIRDDANLSIKKYGEMGVAFQETAKKTAASISEMVAPLRIELDAIGTAADSLHGRKVKIEVEATYTRIDTDAGGASKQGTGEFLQPGGGGTSYGNWGGAYQ